MKGIAVSREERIMDVVSLPKANFERALIYMIGSSYLGIPQYLELVSPPPKILNRFFLSATSAVCTFSALINHHYLHLQSISIDLRSIEAIYIVYCLQYSVESLLSSSLL